MGRELRRVIPNWEHPEKDGYEDRLQPMFDNSYIKEMDEWIKNHNLWQTGKHPDQIGENGSESKYFAEWDGGPPDIEYYRPNWKESEMTWYQVYETVSEGTPVSPPFETQQELIDYLMENGDFWDQKRRKDPRNIGGFRMKCDPWSKAAAERFVMGSGWAPSMIVTGGKIMSGVEALAEIKPLDNP